jgi:membrane fusion protein (multidrug efflux system)
MLQAFEKEGDINSTFARLAADAPDVKRAEAKLDAGKRDQRSVSIRRGSD